MSQDSVVSSLVYKHVNPVNSGRSRFFGSYTWFTSFPMLQGQEAALASLNHVSSLQFGLKPKGFQQPCEGRRKTVRTLLCSKSPREGTCEDEQLSQRQNGHEKGIVRSGDPAKWEETCTVTLGPHGHGFRFCLIHVYQAHDSNNPITHSAVAESD